MPLDLAPQPLRSRQLFEQRLSILQIGRIETLREPAVDRGEEVAMRRTDAYSQQRTNHVRLTHVEFEQIDMTSVGQ